MFRDIRRAFFQIIQQHFTREQNYLKMYQVSNSSQHKLGAAVPLAFERMVKAGLRKSVSLSY